MTSPEKPIRRRDATGHLDPQYEADLLAKARESRNADATDDRAFLGGPLSNDELAEELGEAFIQSATTGEESEPDRHDQITPAETGGPFVPSTAAEEFGMDIDASNIPEATREPFPTTSKVEP